MGAYGTNEDIVSSAHTAGEWPCTVVQQTALQVPAKQLCCFCRMPDVVLLFVTMELQCSAVCRLFLEQIKTGLRVQQTACSTRCCQEHGSALQESYRCLQGPGTARYLCQWAVLLSHSAVMQAGT